MRFAGCAESAPPLKRLPAHARIRQIQLPSPLPLGQPSFCVKVAALPSAYRSSTDFSCWTYNTTAKALQFFSGGGHAAHWHTSIISYDVLADKFTQEYPSTPLTDMTGANVLLPSKFWKTTGHPQSTHTYARSFIYSHALRDMVLLATLQARRMGWKATEALSRRTSTAVISGTTNRGQKCGKTAGSRVFQPADLPKINTQHRAAII